MKPLEVPEARATTTTFRGLLQNTNEQSPNVNATLGEMVRNAGQRISLHFPFFMYLWRAIKSGCLDGEITPCLPTNKPPALVSSPLFIMHNLLWCQGQSDCIVMVKGKSGDPEPFSRTENSGATNKKIRHLGFWAASSPNLGKREKVTQSNQRGACSYIKTKNKSRTLTILLASFILTIAAKLDFV